MVEIGNIRKGVYERWQLKKLREQIYRDGEKIKRQSFFFLFFFLEQLKDNLKILKNLNKSIKTIIEKLKENLNLVYVSIYYLR
jgi:hypothetical protein